MPTPAPPSLTTDQIDDLLHLARLGSTASLLAALNLLSTTFSADPLTILTATLDQDTGNGLLHMAAANGHTATLKELFALSSSSSSSSSLSLNLQNKSGNTPLHWAALNGHLAAVKLLVETGADPGVVNKAGKEAVDEAEAGGKEKVVDWLLREGKSVVGQAASGAREGEGGEVDVERVSEKVGERGGETEE